MRSVDLAMAPINILIGANGAGKSSFLSFFKMLNYMTSRGLQLYVGRAGGGDALLHYGSKVTPRMVCRLTFGTDQGTNVYEMRLVSAAGDSLIFADELVSFSRHGQNARPATSLGEAGHKETALGETKVEKLQQTSVIIRSIMARWRVYHFHDTSPEANIKKRCTIKDNEYLRDDARNLAAFLYRLKLESPNHYTRIIQTIRQFAPWFGDFVLVPSLDNTETISLSWLERGSDYPFTTDQLSDGTIRMIAMITVLLQPNLPSSIILDEPELGLHPYALTMLADLLKAASTKAQVIVATQSAYLVDQFSADAILVTERTNNQTVFKRLHEEELAAWLEEYSLGELWEKNVFGGRPSLCPE